MRSLRSLICGFLVAGIVALSTFVSAIARAQTKEECVDAFERGQRLQRELHLVDAAARYAVCTHDVCPLAIRRDCAERFEQTERDIPTIVVGARDAAGADLYDARVLVDGQPFARAASGASQPIDPGTYVVRFEREGYETVDQRVTIRLGEKSRSLVVTMKSLASVHPNEPAFASTPPPTREVPKESPTPRDTGTSPPIAAYATLGAGAASLILGASFGIAVAVRCGGMFKDPCDTLQQARPEERKTRESSLDTQAWIANVAVGAGAALAAVGTYLLVTHHANKRKAVRIAPVMFGNGASLHAVGSF